MTDQSSIFNGNEPATKPQEQAPAAPHTPTNDPLADLLDSIKNERGERKYASLPEALVGLKNAQEYIPQLKAEQAAKEQEIANLRKQAERAQELEATIAALTSRQNEPANNQTPVFDESKLAEMVNRQLTLKEQQAAQAANVRTVVSTLQQSFGADAEAKLYGKAEEMGMSREEINTLAAKSPKAVLTMLGITQAAAAQKFTPTSPSKVNTDSLQTTPESYIGRNPNTVLIGATTRDVMESSLRAKKMAEELEARGMSVHELTDPKVYAKYFGKK